MKSIVSLSIFSLILFTITQAEDLPKQKVENQPAQPLLPNKKFPNVTLDQQIDEQQLQQIEETYNQEKASELSAWVSKQLQDSKSIRDIAMAQSFIIHLQTDQSYEYRWDLNIPKSNKRDFTLLLNAYTYQDGTDISLPHGPEQDSFITVEIKQDMPDSYKQLGTVYITKAFSVHFQKEAKILRFTNFHPFPVLLEINMEAELKHLSLIKQTIAVDKHFEMSASKMNTIVEQAKQTDKTRTQTYKWEWGFLQREERYEDEMVRLTGVELFIILATALIQMYCLRSLLENKQIV